MKRTRIQCALTLLTLGLFGQAALAGDLHVPLGYPTIQAAIDAAAPGDTVIVADGTYTGPGNRDMDFGGKAITVRSANGPAACIIDVQGSQADPHRAFYFHSGETAGSVLDGFTLRNGFAEIGGAVLCEGGSSPSFDNCVFEQNTAYPIVAGGAGGALYSAAGSARFTKCLFRCNTAVRIAGSQGLGGAMQFVGGSPLLTDCTFEENVAGLAGGGVRCVQASPTLLGCTFLRNSTIAIPPVGGGGGFVANPSGHATLVNCRFIENQTTNIVGGAWINNGTTATITGCSFIGNHGFDAGGLGVGNGGAQAVITNCLFEKNTADIFSAALEVWNAAGNPANAAVANCTFVNNVASAGYAAVVVGNTSSLSAANCVLWDNEPVGLTLLNSGAAALTYSNIQGGWPGAGNINADPLFAGSGAHPYALAGGSPCVDVGDNAAVPIGVVTDLAGNPRFIDDACAAGPIPGAVVDMGAYEHRLYADCNLDGVLNRDDLLCFLSQLAAGAPYADCNGDGKLTGADIGCFASKWATACK